MVIRKEDRVSTVLRSDESLIDVFVGLSPAFERLRNPAMRRVMSRLVTVEQAARMAGVDGDELVARLNARDRSAMGTDARPGGEGNATTLDVKGMPAGLAGISEDRMVELDVREDLREGREPFSRIMAARREVPEGGALRLRAIFEPVPLYAVMEKQGLTHHTEQLGEEDWCVWFWEGGPRPEAPDPPPGDVGVGAASGDAGEAAVAAAAGGDVGGAVGEDGVVVLDVRGLEPPEPMVRTLSALESLPTGGTLVQLNVRVPQFLLPQLEERGFTYRIREQEPGLVRVFINATTE